MEKAEQSGGQERSRSLNPCLPPPTAPAALTFGHLSLGIVFNGEGAVCYDAICRFGGFKPEEGSGEMGSVFKLSLVVWLGWAMGSGAAEYPVDEEIAALKAKAEYLEALKGIFAENRCVVSFDGNEVALSAGALRSEGLVMAIGRNFPGQYLAYHRAPKPEMLARVVSHTLLRGEAGEGAVIVGSRLTEVPGRGDRILGLFVAEPWEVEGTDGLWLYRKTFVNFPVPQPGVRVEREAKTSSGLVLKVACN